MFILINGYKNIFKIAKEYTILYKKVRKCALF